MRLWYHYFTIHTSTYGFFVHPYFCFRPSANSLYDGFTCGYITAAAPAIADVAAVPTAGIPAAAVAAVSAITPVSATKLAQYHLTGHFQPNIDNMNLNI